MPDNDEVWRWDDSQAVEYEGSEARKYAAQVLMEITGASNVKDARDVLLGRPSLAEQGREKS